MIYIRSQRKNMTTSRDRLRASKTIWRLTSVGFHHFVLNSLRHSLFELALYRLPRMFHALLDQEPDVSDGLANINEFFQRIPFNER